MDAYNLAICFGPTLMPAPEDKDQVQYQNQVNELIKNMIVYHEELFAKDLGGTAYEKFISQEPFDGDVGDSPTDQVTEDPDSEVYPSEDGKQSSKIASCICWCGNHKRIKYFNSNKCLPLAHRIGHHGGNGAVRFQCAIRTGIVVAQGRPSNVAKAGVQRLVARHGQGQRWVDT